MAWAALSLLGGALVALPDSGERVFSVSATHGPAWLDLAGICLLLLGLAAFVGGAWRGRHHVSRAMAWGAGTAFAAGNLLSAWSVGTDAASWWIAGVGLAAAAQLALAWQVWQAPGA